MEQDYGDQPRVPGFVCLMLEVTYQEIAKLAAKKQMTVPEFVTRAVLHYAETMETPSEEDTQ